MANVNNHTHLSEDPTDPTADDGNNENEQMAEPEHIYEYDLPVDENGKAKSIKLWSVRRPHMRAFHFAWLSFFLAFFGWFALAPLQSNVSNNRNTAWLNVGNRFKYQNIIAVTGTVFMRFLIGPVCDRFGPRIAQSALLGIFSLPVFLVSTAQSYAAWTSARFFIGFIGAAFVVTQFWTSIMFSGNIVGTANATSAGWGNLGGGVTQAVMPLIKKGMLRAIGGEETEDENIIDDRDDRAWRLSMIFPGTALLLTSISLYLFTDDLPHGQYADLHKAGTKEKTNPFAAFGRAARNWRSWILFILYGMCFGVELIMNGNLATYFRNKTEAFELTETTAGLIAALFGLMNLFARSLGGIFSDVLASKFGMRGRLWAFFIVQLAEGILFVVFSRIRILGAAIPTLILFSTCVQMAEGATFGIVPFVDPLVTGAVSGIVGAGGNAGAVFGGFLVAPKDTNGIADGFRNIGFVAIGSSFLIMLLWWPEYGSMFFPPSVQSGKVIDDNDEAVHEDADDTLKGSPKEHVQADPVEATS